MIRSIDIDAGHTPFDTDVVVLAEIGCALSSTFRDATVNIFGKTAE